MACERKIFCTNRVFLIRGGRTPSFFGGSLLADISWQVITVIPSANHGPFAGLYPELTDFNVLKAFKGRIGTALIEKAEQEALKYSDVVTWVGLVKWDMGPAHIKREHIFQDGSGLWFNNEVFFCPICSRK